MGTLAFLFKLIPTVRPFFKEFFLGDKIPNGGKVRNPLINVLIGVVLVGLMGVGYGVDYWISKYDEIQNLELAVDKLKQELAASEARANALNDEATKANGMWGEFARTKSELDYSKKRLEEVDQLNNSLATENTKLLKRVKDLLNEANEEAAKCSAAVATAPVKKHKVYKPVAKTPVVSRHYQTLLVEEP